MMCHEIVNMIRDGKLRLNEKGVGPAAIARPLRSDLIRYRVILKALARGYDGPYKIRYVCTRNRDGGFRGCLTCLEWYAPSVCSYVEGAETKNPGFCISRRKVRASEGQAKIDM